MAMGMDTVIHLGHVTVSEASATFGSAGALCSISLQQESGESCEEKYTAHTIIDKNLGAVFNGWQWTVE